MPSPAKRFSLGRSGESFLFAALSATSLSGVLLPIPLLVCASFPTQRRQHHTVCAPQTQLMSTPRVSRRVRFLKTTFARAIWRFSLYLDRPEKTGGGGRGRREPVGVVS